MAQKFFIRTDTLIKLTNTQDAETGEFISDCDSVKMTLCYGIKLHPDQSFIEFTGGGEYEVQEGDVINGQTSGAQARVTEIIVDSGDWTGRSAKGRLKLLDQYGTFSAGESCSVDTFNDVIRVTGDSTGAESFGPSNVLIPVEAHGIKNGDFVWIDGSRNYDGIEATVTNQKGKLNIVAAFVAEKFTGEEDIYHILPNGKEIVLTHDAVGPPADAAGYYDGVLPDTISGLEEDVDYYLFVELIKGGTRTLLRVKWPAVFFPDTL